MPNEQSAPGPLKKSGQAGAGRRWPKPLVVAHRGASGYLPEHTLESYALAAGMGADFLEPDVVLTRDHVPICLHDIYLDRVTDVERRFPGRAREDGRFYVLDFSLDEVRSLTATGGTRHGMRGMQIPTLEEMIAMTRHLESKIRPLGIAPEIKSPAFHQDAEAPIVRIVAGVLRASGYADDPARCIVQSFEPDALVELRRDLGVTATLLELLSGDPPSADELASIAQRADAIGPPKSMIMGGTGRFMADAHARGLAVIPYTFQDDEAETRRFFREHRVDGLFSDFTDVALRARDH